MAAPGGELTGGAAAIVGCRRLGAGAEHNGASAEPAEGPLLLGVIVEESTVSGAVPFRERCRSEVRCPVQSARSA
jgi:hypothetical protein